MADQDNGPGSAAQNWLPSFFGAVVLFLLLYGLALYVGHTLAS